MIEDILQDNWRQLRGRVQEIWIRLTDDDLDMINGRTDQLIRKLQERYGYAHRHAEQQVLYFIGYVEEEMYSMAPAANSGF